MPARCVGSSPPSDPLRQGEHRKPQAQLVQTLRPIRAPLQGDGLSDGQLCRRPRGGGPRPIAGTGEIKPPLRLGASGDPN